MCVSRNLWCVYLHHLNINLNSISRNLLPDSSVQKSNHRPDQIFAEILIRFLGDKSVGHSHTAWTVIVVQLEPQTPALKQPPHTPKINFDERARSVNVCSFHCMCECLKRNVFSNDSFHVEKDIFFPSIENVFFFFVVCTLKSVFLSLRSNVCFSSQRRFTKRSTSGFVLDYSIFSYIFPCASVFLSGQEWRRIGFANLPSIRCSVLCVK